MTDLELRNLFSFTMGIAVLAGGAWAIKRWLSGGKTTATPPTQPAPDGAVAEAVQAGNWLKAARLSLDAGDWRSAADHFISAQRPLDAGRALRKGEAWLEAAADTAVAAGAYGFAAGATAAGEDEVADWAKPVGAKATMKRAHTSDRVIRIQCIRKPARLVGKRSYCHSPERYAFELSFLAKPTARHQMTIPS